MDENILAAVVLPYESESFIGVVPFNRTDAFLVGPTPGCRCDEERGAERRSVVLVI